MEYRLGMWVRIPRQPAWGEGKVVGVEHDKVRILFSEVGEKSLVTRMVEAEEVPAPANVSSARPKLHPLRNVDLLELERLCHNFHEQFKDRRSNTDDGGMGLEVLNDMTKRGDLTKKTAKKLFSWCQTGASFAQGVDLAQQICDLIYGRIPTRTELQAAGLL